MFKTTLKIDGMMCGMCEAHVNEAIRNALPSAKKVTSSHTKGESSFITETEPDKVTLKEVIDKTGYTVMNVEIQPYTKKFLGLF